MFRFGGGFLWCGLFFCECIVSESVVCRFGLGTVGEIRVQIVHGVNSILTRTTVIAGQKFPTSFPGFSLLLRERNTVAAGHVAPKMWEPKIREGRRVNNCRYDKSYSVGT